MKTLKEFKNEFRLICTDTWGDAMGAWFEVAGHLYQRGETIPEQWKYRPGLSPLDEDSYFNPLFEETESKLLSDIGKFLFRYCQFLKFKGKDY